MNDFYSRALTRLLEGQLLSREMSILVVCGGQPDKEALLGMGFQHVTISNLDARYKENEFAPFAWSYQDAENLTFGDGEFDICIVHQGLHHCYSPHRALLEMYRVARKGVLVFEPRDTLLVRLGVALGFGERYEVAAVAGNRLEFGGVRNTAIPNHIYRWTESEVRKTIRSYDPCGEPRFHFMYCLRVSAERVRKMKNRPVALATRLSLPLLKLLIRLWPKQGNNFAFFVEKAELPRDLHPWLTLVEGRAGINRGWVRQRYGES
jgi:SAM-dependent methyltransferase